MRKQIQEIREALQRGHRFVTVDVWSMGRPGEEMPSGIIIKQVRVVFLLLTKLLDGNLMLRASALTFATLLSIVPMLAVMFYIIQTFNLGEGVYSNLQERLETAIVDTVEYVPGFGREEEAAAGHSEAVDGEAEQVAGVAGDAGGDAGVVADDEEAQPEDDVGDTAVVEGEVVEEEVVEELTGYPDELMNLSPGDEKDRALQDQVVSSIFQGVGQQNEDMEDPVQWLTDLANQLSELAEDAASNTAAFGLSTIILVMTTVFGLMQNIEKSFNSIWGVRRTRSWYRMMSDYVMITLLVPFVMAVALGITGALQSDRIVEALGPLAIVLQSSQYILLVMIFSTLYYLVPNTSVKIGYALFGGIIAATLWILLSWSYITFQIGLAKYQAVLSVFAQFPMLLMWIYLSWGVLLFGAEVTYAYQNEKTFTMERFADNASFAYRAALGLRAMIELGRRFQESLPSLQPEVAALEWNVPSRLIRDALVRLEESGFITECATEPISYQPARPLEKITAGEVLQSMYEDGEDPSLFLKDAAYEGVFDELLHPKGGVHDSSIAQLIDAVNAPSPEDSADA